MKSSPLLCVSSLASGKRSTRSKEPELSPTLLARGSMPATSSSRPASWISTFQSVFNFNAPGKLSQNPKDENSESFPAG